MVAIRSYLHSFTSTGSNDRPVILVVSRRTVAPDSIIFFSGPASQAIPSAMGCKNRSASRAKLEGIFSTVNTRVVPSGLAPKTPYYVCLSPAGRSLNTFATRVTSRVRASLSILFTLSIDQKKPMAPKMPKPARYLKSKLSWNILISSLRTGEKIPNSKILFSA